MESMFALMDTPAWLVLLMGTLLLMWWMSYFGFRPKEIKQLLQDFRERRQTEIGKQANLPMVIEYLEGSGGVTFILTPLVVLLLVGLIFFQLPVGLLNFLALSILLVEALGIWKILEILRKRYQADYDEYMRLTAPGNDFFLAHDVRCLSGAPEDGISEALFFSQDAAGLVLGYPHSLRGRYPLPEPGTWLMVFYQTDPSAYAVDGVLVGFQCVPRQSEVTGPTLPHILRDFDQYREGQMN